MKKLLFAIVGAAAFAASAADPAVGDNIDVLGFENFDLTNPNVTGAVIERDDSGISGTSKWSCSGDDASLVKAYGGADAATAPSGITFPAPFDGAGDNYLALDTNGSELQRAIPAAGQTIAADGTYIDTLVQFTPSESAPDATTDLAGAKLAIWLGVDSANNTTNLMVQGGFLEGPVAEGTPTIDTTATQAYKLGNIEVEPGQWYRLTVKAIKLDDDGGGNTISGFQIYIDGTLAVSDTAVADAAGIQYYTDFADEAGVFPGAAGLLSAKTLIPSCAGVIADATLTSVGFKGTGALDDFVVTTEAPEFTPAATYPTYIDTNDGTIKGKYDAWKTAYQADTASQWESAFLLNMDPTAQVAAGTALLKIASITEVSGGWELEIASEATTLTATDGTVLVGNGYLRIIAADTIAGLANATPTYINVAVTNGKITVTVPAANGKFMKAELTTEAPSDN